MAKIYSSTVDTRALEERIQDLVPDRAAGAGRLVDPAVTPEIRSAAPESLATRLIRRVRAFLRFRRTVVSHLGRVDRQMDELRQQVQTLLEAACRSPAAGSAEASPYPDYYVGLENLYRGESQAIEARFSPYLAFIREAAAGGSQDPILDLGCGRGEWLAVLRREGLCASGVDSDASMLEQARSRGASVVQGDLLSFIEAAAPASYGAITAFQVVEHLPLEVLMRLFAASARALRPGGVLIFETPNPENLQVSGYSFWLDPTHVRPLPPPLLDYFARYFGFIEMRIVRSNPWPLDRSLEDASPAAQYLNKLLFCEQDYALVARKPS